MSKSINSRFDSFRALIFSCRNEEISAQLVTQGVDAEFLNENEARLNKVMRLMEQQKRRSRWKRGPMTSILPRKLKSKKPCPASPFSSAPN